LKSRIAMVRMELFNYHQRGNYDWR